MNREPKDAKSQDEDFEDTEVLLAEREREPDTDNVGDASVEINVDELISEVEAEGLPADHYKDASARKKLDELLEEKRMSRETADIDDFDFDFDFD